MSVGPSGGVVTVFSTTITLTNAQIKALPTTPVTIVAAQAGKRYKFNGASVVTDVRGGVYTNLAGSGKPTLTIGVIKEGAVIVGGRLRSFDELIIDDGDVYQSEVSPLGIWVDDASDSVFNNNVYTSLDDLINQPIGVLADNGASGDLTGGHASNSFVITVEYTVIDE